MLSTYQPAGHPCRLNVAICLDAQCGLQGALLQCGLILLSGLLLWGFRSDDGGYAAIH